jgi:hypothetical protein
MSNQVYRNDKPAVPNVYISDILQPGPGGGATVKSLTITDVPTGADNDGFPFLVRDTATGLVKQRVSASVPFAGYSQRHLDADQVIADATDTVVLFPIDDHSDIALSYNPGTGVFTVLATGLWTISYTLAFGLSVVNFRYTWLTLNGGIARYAADNKPSVNDSLMTGCLSTGLANGDTFQLHAFQDSGAPLAVQGLLATGRGFTTISATRVTPSALF